MNQLGTTLAALLVAGLFVTLRRGVIPRGPGKALAQVVALLAIIVMAGFILSPLGD
jgi:hypothetical protein